MVVKSNYSKSNPNPMDLYLARAINYANRYGKDKSAIEKYLEHRQEKQNKQIEGTEMQQKRWYRLGNKNSQREAWVDLNQIIYITGKMHIEGDNDIYVLTIGFTDGNSLSCPDEFYSDGTYDFNAYTEYLRLEKALQTPE